MIDVVNCPKPVTVVCQRFCDPDPLYYLYQDQAHQEQHLLQLTQKHPNIVPNGAPYYTKTDHSVYNQIVKGNGVLEGSHQAPLPCDQDEA